MLREDGVPSRRVVDLSLTLGGPHISALRGVPTFQKEAVHTHTLHGRSNTRISFNIHTATHVDCPSHYIPDGATVDVMLEAYMGPAVGPTCVQWSAPGQERRSSTCGASCHPRSRCAT